jgi:hypothetical protein
MTNRFGTVSASAALVANIGYAVPQLLQVTGRLHDPWDRILIFAPSLVLAPAFVLAIAVLHAASRRPSRRALSAGALAIAVMYAVLVSLVYVTQLGVVIPHDIAGDGKAYALLACCAPGQFLTEVDLLGYTLMSVATLLAAPLFPRRGILQIGRWAFLANGLLAPFLILQLAYPQLIYVGALWLITFPLSMVGLVLVFRRPEAHRTLHARPTAR